ncbi:MAG: DUF554 domain-containing protein [Syntrophomonadaceae bacterium]|nr:DUF554 domain-containing protein [Syntrophomonadaceae bacterium]
MLGSVVNFLAIAVGGGIGLIFKKGLPEKIGETVMYGLALCVLYIGFSGALSGENILIVVLSMAIGAVLGEWIDLDRYIISLGNWLEARYKGQEGTTSISQGFVTASLLFCVGALAIVGSLQSGLTGNHETLFTKSLIDGIAAIILASSLGAGVILSAGAVLIYQGTITLLAQVLSPYLTPVVINEMTCVGSLIIIGLALNMLKITRLKVMNLVPAIFFPIILCLFM